MTTKNEIVTIGVDDVFYESTPTKKFLARKPYTGPDPRRITSVLPGIVQNIKIAAGQEVKRGDKLLTLEAMKMENVLCAPRDGRIKSVLVAAGEMVPKGKLIIEYEE